jgi:hypothetical protein
MAKTFRSYDRNGNPVVMTVPAREEFCACGAQLDDNALVSACDCECNACADDGCTECANGGAS